MVFTPNSRGHNRLHTTSMFDPHDHLNHGHVTQTRARQVAVTQPPSTHSMCYRCESEAVCPAFCRARYACTSRPNTAPRVFCKATASVLTRQTGAASACPAAPQHAPCVLVTYHLVHVQALKVVLLLQRTQVGVGGPLLQRKPDTQQSRRR